MLHSLSSVCVVFGDLNDCLLVLMDLAHGKAPGIYNSGGEEEGERERGRARASERKWSER